MPVLLTLVALTSAVSAAQQQQQPDLVSAALQDDDQCAVGDGECALNALQLRGEKKKIAAESGWGCAQYGCGSSYVSWHSCQCNSKCASHGNCCLDYGSLCMGPAPTPSAPSPPPYIHPPAPLPSPPTPASGGSGGSAASFNCATDLPLGPVVQGHAKGIALDDDTFKGCSAKIPQHFPNTDTPITSMRLFKAWDLEWEEGDREAAWANIVDYVHANGVKVLLGTEITCNKQLDDQSWEWAKALLKLLGPDHVMGLGIGNELELLSRMGNRRKIAPVTPACVEDLWGGSYVQTKFDSIVAEFDEMGFGSVPVTTVLGGYSLAGSPFVNKHDAKIYDLLRHLQGTYGSRFVFTFNFYPYFDTNMHLDSNRHTCHGALNGALNWGSHGFMPGIIGAASKRVAQMAPGARVWLGETGWSSPFAPSLESQMKHCADWSSPNTLKTFYENFLKWPLHNVEHVFYFTARDSEVFGVPEHFGLIATCQSSSCKLTATNSLLQANATALAEVEAMLPTMDSFPPSRLAQALM